MASSNVAAVPAAAPASELIRQVTRTAREIYRQRLDPVAERLLLSIPLPAGERQGHPMVLVLGNHSAGKSTFINHLLGRDVQKTGVAPTDDGFTVLTGGTQDEERDGASLVTTPELGLGELERFGPTLLSHVSLKIRAGCPILQHLWLVDSPGMVDAADESIDRGYDFFGVVRWLAERSDVILLLFDPEKPGTTGETLKALTTSLVQLEHKLLIAMNKADEFSSIEDFARAYGALCWNLAKVIPRKDLPRIYNCYVPGPGRPAGNGSVPVEDFDLARKEIVSEVAKAPERRIDNVVTRLHDDARELLVHARVCGFVRREYVRRRIQWSGRAVAFGLAFDLGAAVAYHMLGAPQSTAGVLVGIGLAGAAALIAWGAYAARTEIRELVADLTPAFEHVYRRHLVLADEGDLRDLWDRLHPRTRKALQTLGPENVPRVSARELRHVEEVLSRRIPELRTGLYARAQHHGQAALSAGSVAVRG
jgi:hypothetical protein